MSMSITSDRPAPPSAGMASVAEHELRTPLTSMRSVAEVLRDYPDLSDGQRRRFLDSIIEDGARLELTLVRVAAWMEAIT